MTCLPKPFSKAVLCCCSVSSASGKPLSWLGCGWVVTAVQNGTLAFPAGMEGTVSVFSSGDAARGVTLRGLLYEITDAELRCAMPLGVSNSFTGAAATVRVTDGTVFVLWQGNALPDGLEVRHGAD